ncbi:hypothetical protein M0802_010387 [Mischocyttarus mexicanus]|nr:hypothetical protein M0802_010387 [Mischocyttarus mexicanus]
MKFIAFGSLFIILSLLVISGQTQEANSSQSTFDNNDISISLLNYPENEAFKKRITLAPASNYAINISDIPSIVSFLIFQVHTYQYNITLSYDKLNLNKVSNRSLFGSNIGLYIIPKKDGLTFFIKNDNVKNVEALLAIVSYSKQAPVPGGCNMEFDIEVAPYQKLLVNDSIVIVDSQPASLPSTNDEIKKRCEKYTINPEAYRFYLTEQDFSVESYFNAITDMLTVTDIIRNGEKISPSITSSSLRRVNSLYYGTGTVYAAIVTYGNDSSAYVPVFTYGFNYLLNPEDRHLLNNTLSLILCSIMLLIGIICSFLEHRYYHMEFATYTTLFGGIISYILVKSLASYDVTTNIGISIGGGFIFLIIIGIISCCYKTNLTVFFSVLSFGFLCSSIAYFNVKDSLLILENDWTFWLIYLSIALIVIIILIIMPFFALSVTCAVLGGFMIVLSIAYFADSILVYIVINVIRRLTVPTFKYAIVSHPLQAKDISLIVFWILLIIFRISKEFCSNISCFNCRRNQSSSPYGFINVESDRSPLVGNALYKARVLVYLRPRAH